MMNRLRRIAAHRLWRPEGMVEHPLVTLSPEGRVVLVESVADPDRRAATEFYAGVLVAGFPADYRAAFAAMQARGGSLSERLPEVAPADPGRWVVISGIDYDTFRLTETARIEALCGSGLEMRP